ncbi:Prophage endopeptidase tail [Enterococcus faecalis]|uniref:phage tail protein n=1 Tax=Enterococcus TaxID=1350 RepID=UPI00045B5B9E|nr:phage tail protein [Enterococcus faecalis]KAJ80423.1 Phage lysin [Enterococcus faecalis MTUP9]SDN56525.1 Prophage endopeptidase tail [Enterococcus faecalis]
MEVIIESLDKSQRENLLPYIDPESFCIEEEANTKNQISFTLSVTHAISSLLADIEAVVLVNNQTYIIKQLENSYEQETKKKKITATHLFFETQNYRSYRYAEGKKTYSIQQLLEHYFKDNERGFRWSVHGEFPKVEIENLGHGSLRDGVQQVLAKYPKTYIRMDNLFIHFYTEKEWLRKNQKVLHYYHDTQNVTLAVNSLEMSNIVKCFGGKDDKGKEYFPPFFVENSQSIKAFGKKYLEDISDERFRKKQEMTIFAKGKLKPEPDISLQMIFAGNVNRPILGEQYPFILHMNDYQTEVTIMSYRWYPLAPYKLAEITFNNLAKSFLQYHNQVEKEVKEVKKEQKKVNQSIKDVDNKLSTVTEIAEDAKQTANQVDQKATDAQEKAEKALAGQIFGKVVGEVENY